MLKLLSLFSLVVIGKVLKFCFVFCAKLSWAGAVEYAIISSNNCADLTSNDLTCESLTFAECEHVVEYVLGLSTRLSAASSTKTTDGGRPNNCRCLLTKEKKLFPKVFFCWGTHVWEAKESVFNNRPDQHPATERRSKICKCSGIIIFFWQLLLEKNNRKESFLCFFWAKPACTHFDNYDNHLGCAGKRWSADIGGDIHANSCTEYSNEAQTTGFQSCPSCGMCGTVFSFF